MSSLVLLPRPPLAYASSEAFPLIMESWISSSSSGSPQALRQKIRHSSSGWVVFLCFFLDVCVMEAKIPQRFLCSPIT